MNTSLQKELLGYVLGALDATEERNIQQKIADNPQLQEQIEIIRSRLSPLDCLDHPASFPAGLARRTCERIAASHKGQHRRPTSHGANDRASTPSGEERDLTALALQAVEQYDADLARSRNRRKQAFPTPPKADNQVAAETTSPDHQAKLSPARYQVPHSRTWSRTNVLAATAMLMILCGLLLPAIAYSRFNSRVLACQNNLRQIGHALLQYSDMNNGNFVAIPTAGKLASIGYFAPVLKHEGFIEDDSVFACAGKVGMGTDRPVFIPSYKQIETAAPCQLTHLRKTMSGDYGYSMGYMEDDKYHPLPNSGLKNTVVVADMPSLHQPGRRSMNHNQYGQNCLFGDGRVEFIKGDSIGEDAIFVNDYGVVAPGTSQYDSVVAPSHLAPVNW